MAGATPTYVNLSFADLMFFDRVVEMIDHPTAPAKNYVEIARRLGKDNELGHLFADKKKKALTQPSEHVRKMSERLFGDPDLLIRATKNKGIIAVLQEGRELREFAKAALKVMERAQYESANKRRVTLTISAGRWFSANILPILLRDYLSDSPPFRYVWIQENSHVDETLRDVSWGLCDFGVTLEDPAAGLVKTELCRLRHNIMLSKIKKKNVEDRSGHTPIYREDLPGEVLISQVPRVLRLAGIEDVFPEPNEKGVRIFCTSENTIRGWIHTDVAIGHVRALEEPYGATFIHTPQGKDMVTWFVYARPHVAAMSDREQAVQKVIQEMKKASKGLAEKMKKAAEQLATSAARL